MPFMFLATRVWKVDWLVRRPIEIQLLRGRTPSNVSISASWTRKVLLKALNSVELSLRTKRAVVSGANGPEVKAIAATWGT